MDLLLIVLAHHMNLPLMVLAHHMDLTLMVLAHHIYDEKHFLFYCPVYSIMRKTLGDKATEIDPNYVNLDDEQKFKLLMSDLLIKHTAIFLYNAYDRRKLLTYV